MTIFEQKFSLQKLSQRFQITLNIPKTILQQFLDDLRTKNFLGKMDHFWEKSKAIGLGK